MCLVQLLGNAASSDAEQWRFDGTFKGTEGVSVASPEQEGPDSDVGILNPQLTS